MWLATNTNHLRAFLISRLVPRTTEAPLSADEQEVSLKLMNFIDQRSGSPSASDK